jgi:hypothetical protein
MAIHGQPGHQSELQQHLFRRNGRKITRRVEARPYAAGFKPDDSVVSIYSGWSLNNICYFASIPIHETIQH